MPRKPYRDYPGPGDDCPPDDELVLECQACGAEFHPSESVHDEYGRFTCPTCKSDLRRL